jgi:hypothetical protein
MRGKLCGWRVVEKTANTRGLSRSGPTFTLGRFGDGINDWPTYARHGLAASAITWAVTKIDPAVMYLEYFRRPLLSAVVGSQESALF